MPLPSPLWVKACCYRVPGIQFLLTPQGLKSQIFVEEFQDWGEKIYTNMAAGPQSSPVHFIPERDLQSVLDGKSCGHRSAEAPVWLVACLITGRHTSCDRSVPTRREAESTWPVRGPCPWAGPRPARQPTARISGAGRAELLPCSSLSGRVGRPGAPCPHQLPLVHGERGTVLRRAHTLWFQLPFGLVLRPREYLCSVGQLARDLEWPQGL